MKIFLLTLVFAMIITALAITQKPNPDYKGSEYWETCGTLGCE